MSTTLVTDARNRALRTFVQGVGIDVLVAIAAVLLVWLPDADVSNKEAWLVLGTSVVKSVLTALASYVMRAKLDGSGFSPTPPANPGPNTNEGGAVSLLVLGLGLAVLGLVLFIATTLNAVGLILLVVGILVAAWSTIGAAR